MASNQTANYSLSQWERTDRVLMEDFNADNAKIDAAIRAQADALAAETVGRRALEARVDKCGNCKIWSATYTGTGTLGADNPVRVTFPGMPVFAIVACSGGPVMWLTPGCTGCSVQGLHTSTVSETVSWNGTSVSWYVTGGTAEHQFNGAGRRYHVFAFLQADA